MAFGKKFYSSYKSNNNLDYYLEIWIDGHTGGNTELTMGAGGPVIEYETDQEDRFSPIISSSCKIPYLVEDNIDSAFVDTLRTTYQERQVYIHIYRASSSTYHTVAPLWSGFLVMDLGKGQDKSFPYVQELKFVDGLALLKDIDFVDLNVAGGTPPFEERVQGNYAEENMYFGPATYIYWFREILAKTGASLTAQGSTLNYGFTTSVNWYNGDMNSTGQSSDPLHKTKCQVSMFHRKDDQEVYFPDNCYNVLKELLRHWGARITYWKHEFYIVQIPEYITGESGSIDNPQNNNSRVYSNLGTYQGSQDHLGSTYWTRYFQEISNTKISKLTGTKYEYLPIVKQVNADFLSFSSKSVFGGFPFGATALQQEVFQGTLNSPSTADFLWLSIPLDWAWDCPNFPQGHESGWWSSIKFNFYASDGTTTYYLQFDSTSQTLPYYWVDSANWTPLGPRSPRYIISSKSLNVTAHVGFEQKIPFKDSSGNAITMTGAWSFYLDLHSTGTSTGYGNSGSNPGCFYLNFSGYTNPPRMRNPNVGVLLSVNGVLTNSGTVSWSNSLQDSQGSITISTITNPSGFNAGTSQDDIRFATTSPFLGLLQLLTDGQSAAFGQSYNTLNTSSAAAKANSDQFDFGRLLWGDSTEFARSSLQVFDGSNYVNTTASGLWGRGTLTGSKTFTQLLLDEFLYGQTKIIISPSMRLIVGEQNKNETQGSATRPRYVNPIGKLRETRDGTDPEYFFRRGSFYTLLDEWDYEGYQIIRNEVTTTNQNNSIGSSGGNQSNAPNNSAMMPNPTTQALAQNSPLAYISQTIPATGSNVAVNGNFNVATGWTLGTGWTIDTTEKKAKFAATGSTSELVQSVLTQELTYQINFQVDVTAGTLLVKAGTSGQTQTITSSGDYSIYLTCEGSSDIKFQAGTTFTGSITYITLRDQKSLSSVPINEIGSAVFKTGDTFNLINSNSDEILALTVTSNQGSSDTSISVSSTPLYDDIDAGSYLLINQDDLSAQYQNKTKGTVGGFDITATSIDSGSVAISSYIDDDTFGTASDTSLATSESIKAYVDTQVGSADTLAEVLANGNTTGGNNISVNDNDKITFGASSDLEIYHTTTNGSFIRDVGSGNFNIQTDGNGIFIEKSTGPNMGVFRPDAQVELYYNGSEKFRTTNSGISITGGGVFTDQVTIPATPVASTDAASKGYVDTQVGSADTLQEVTDNGNTTTNSITFAGGTSTGDITGQSITLGDGSTAEKLRVFYSDNSFLDINGYGLDLNRSFSYIRPLSNNSISFLIGSSSQNFYDIRNYGITHKWFNASSELMRLTSTGLGIGTTSPSAKLEIEGNGAILDIDNDSSGVSYLRFLDNASSKFAFRHNIANSYLGIYDYNSSSDALVVKQGGNVGINQVNPTEKLHVVGDALITGDSHADTFKPAVSGNPIKFKRYDGNEVGRFKNNGYFGINVSDPQRSLDIGGAVRVLNENQIEWGWGGVRITGSVSTNTFKIGTWGGSSVVDRMTVETDGQLNLSSYGSGSFTGTETYFLAVTSGGDVVEADSSALPGGPYLPLTGGTLTGSLTGTTATFSTAVNTTSSLNFTGNNAYIKVGSAWNTGVLNFLNGATTYLQFDVPNNRIKNNLGKYLTSSGGVAQFGSFDNYDVAFVANNSEKMRLTADGKLGISTTSPTEELSVSGDANITGKLAVGSSAAHASFAFYNQLTSYFNGAVTIDDSLTQTGGSSSTFSGDILPASNIGSSLGSSSKSFLYTYTYVLQSAGILQLGAGGAEKARITSGGNLLLGTTTDDGSNKLQVNGGALFTGSLTFNQSSAAFINHNVNSQSVKFRLSNSSALDVIPFEITPTYMASTVDMYFGDSDKLKFGAGNDLEIFSDGNDGFINNETNHFYITNNANNCDLALRSDDGLGGVTDYIRLDGSQTTVNVYKNLLINTTTDVGVPLYVNGVIRAVGGGIQAAQDYGFTLNDESGSNRYGLKFGAAGSVGGSNLLMLTNRSFNSATGGGEVAIGGNSNTSGVSEVEIARFIPRVTATSGTQKKVSLDAVLELTEQTAPANPASGESIIWMDSESGDLKVKINYGGTTVTRTLAAFEG